MITIDGTYKGKTRFVIPNQVVRDQLFSYLLDIYNDVDLMFSSYEKGNLDSELAYDGNWKDMEHSYIVGLKYAKSKDSDEVVTKLREEAITQANRYAATETVQRNIGHTTLHKIVVVYKGMEMVVCEEIKG